MSTMVTELYQALRAAGVDDGLAKAAAESVLSKDRKEDLATRNPERLSEPRLLRNPLATSATRGGTVNSRLAFSQLTKADLADLKADLIKWNVGTLIAMTALFSTLVTLFKLFS
jgi:hypothetical protein